MNLTSLQQRKGSAVRWPRCLYKEALQYSSRLRISPYAAPHGVQNTLTKTMYVTYEILVLIWDFNHEYLEIIIASR